MNNMNIELYGHEGYRIQDTGYSIQPTTYTINHRHTPYTIHHLPQLLAYLRYRMQPTRLYIYTIQHTTYTIHHTTYTTPHTPHKPYLRDSMQPTALHPPRTQSRANIPPQQRTDRKPRQSVENPPGFLTLHQVEVEISRCIERFQNCVFGNFVKNGSFEGYFGF
jgi:hypothetical protein